MDIRCKQCGRFLASVDGCFDARLKCANCKSFERYRIVTLSALGTTHVYNKTDIDNHSQYKPTLKDTGTHQ